MKTQKGMSINFSDLQNRKLNQTQRPLYGQDNKASVTFENLLENKIGKIIQNNTLPEKLTPIDRNQLTQLAGVIQKQMNDALFHAFGDSKSDSALPEFQLNNISLYGLEGLTNTNIPDINNPIISKGTGAAPSQAEIEGIIEKASSRYDIDPDLTKAVVKAESDFNPGCTSSKGAMGLMQLMPATARELGVRNPYNPGENIYAGTRYLKQLLDRYDGDVNVALSAYNWGMGNVERNPGKLPQETRTYISRVNRYYQEAKTG